MSLRRKPGLLPPDIFAFWIRDEHRIHHGRYFYTWILRTGESKRKLAKERAQRLADGFTVTGIVEYRAAYWGAPWVESPK